MDIYIIRHGETNWNVEGIIQGQSNSSLTEKGIEQAKLTAEKLKTVPFKAIYSSDLERAMNTAEIICEHHKNSTIVKDERLRERKFGDLEGIGHEDFKTRHPEIYANFRSNDPAYRIPGGESRNDLAKRSIDFFNDIISQHADDDTILAVTHGGVVNMFVRYIIGIDYGAKRKYSLLNAAINIVSFKNNDWRLITLGDISHLTSTLDKRND